MFYYTKMKDCNVSNIRVTYSCEGAEYSYPGYVYLSFDGYHEIVVDRNNPNVNYLYSATNYYDPNKVIHAASSVDMNSMTYEFTIDGFRDGCTVSMGTPG